MAEAERADRADPAGDSQALDEAAHLRSGWPGRLRALLDPVVGVFVLAGIFELLAGEPVLHSLLLFAVAAALLWHSSRRRRRAPAGGAGSAPLSATAAGAARRARWRRSPAAVPPGEGVTTPEVAAPRTSLTVGLVALAGLYAVAVGRLSPFTWPMTIAVGVPGIAAVIWSWRSRPRHATTRRLSPLGAAGWGAVFVAFGLWELTNLFLQPGLTVSSYAHPTLSYLVAPLWQSHLGRTIGLLLWLALGWFLLEQ